MDKTEFKKEARKGLYYLGSKFTDTSHITVVLKRIRQADTIGTRRLLNDNNNSLKFITETGKYSYLNISGVRRSISTFTIGLRKFFIILEKIDDSIIMVAYVKDI